MPVNAENTGQGASKLLPFAVPGSSGRHLSEEVAPHGVSWRCNVNNVGRISTPHSWETDTGWSLGVFSFLNDFTPLATEAGCTSIAKVGTCFMPRLQTGLHIEAMSVPQKWGQEFFQLSLTILLSTLRQKNHKKIPATLPVMTYF